MGDSRFSTVPAQVAYRPAQGDVDAVRHVRAGEVGRVAHVEQLSTGSFERDDVVEPEWLERAREHLVKRGVLLAVQLDVMGEIGGRLGLVGRHQRDELLGAHGLQRVVVAALHTDGRHGLVAQVLATHGAGAMPWVDQGVIR